MPELEPQERVSTEQAQPETQEKPESSAPTAEEPAQETFTPPEPLPKNDPSRVIAETTASPLSYQNLILKRYLEQEFSINKHLKVRFRTLSAGVTEFVFRKVSHSHRQEWASVFDEALRIRYVAASLQEFNGNSVGSDLDEAFMSGEDKALGVLNERTAFVQGLPEVMSRLLYAHYVLFSARVDDFIKTGGEAMGNS